MYDTYDLSWRKGGITMELNDEKLIPKLIVNVGMFLLGLGLVVTGLLVVVTG